PDQLGVEGGAPGDRRRIGGGPVGHDAGQAFLMGYRRDAVRGSRRDRRLHAAQVLHALLGTERPAAVGAGEMTETVLDGGLEGVAARLEGGLHGGEALRVAGLRPLPVAAELGSLLLGAQVCEERV